MTDMEGSMIGELTLVLSQMFGGKSSYLMHLLETLGYATRCLYINHADDTRSENPFSTHNTTLDVSQLLKLNADMIKVSRLSQIPDEILRKYQVICVDEGQFMPDLNERVRYMVDILGSEVYVAGLSGDFKRENFGEIHKLLPFADKVVMLRDTLCAVCSASGRRTVALFTKNMEDATGDQVQVGGAEKYIPVCRKCYLSNE
jgi:thymidine kinase